MAKILSHIKDQINGNMLTYLGPLSALGRDFVLLDRVVPHHAPLCWPLALKAVRYVVAARVARKNVRSR